jgi:hypothetical protein
MFSHGESHTSGALHTISASATHAFIQRQPVLAGPSHDHVRLGETKRLQEWHPSKVPTATGKRPGHVSTHAYMQPGTILY